MLGTLLGVKVQSSTVKSLGGAAFRVVFTAVFILFLLSPMPIEPSTTPGIVLALVLIVIPWTILFAIMFRWQLIRIEAVHNPQARMIEALCILFVMFLAIFGKLYHLISVAYPDAFSQHLSYFDSIYLSLTILSTVGFGDISPMETVSRSLVMAQMVLDLALIGVAVRVLTGAAARAQQARAEQQSESD